MGEGKTVTTVVMEGIALLTVNLPRQNAPDAPSWDALAAYLAEYANDPAVQVVVLTGAGHYAFVTDPMAAPAQDQAVLDAAAGRALQAVAQFPKPVIARVRGDCIGHGLLLAMHTDLVIAAADSTFALPAARWGGSYPAESIAALVALIGPQQTKRLLFAGGRIDAAEALRIGLATLLAEDEDLSDIVVDLARAIADNAPLAVRAAKRMVADPAVTGLADACRTSQDYETGVTALRAGRVPLFKGE